MAHGGGDPPEDPSAEMIRAMLTMASKRGTPARGIKRPFFQAFRSGDVVVIDPDIDPESAPPNIWDLLRDITAAPEEAPTAPPTAAPEEAPTATEEAPAHQPPALELDAQTDQYTNKHRQL